MARLLPINGDDMKKMPAEINFLIEKQEVRGRTNCLLSQHIEYLKRCGPHRKHRVQQFYCCLCIRYRGFIRTGSQKFHVTFKTFVTGNEGYEQ
jgi:hypothetical protein